MSISQPQLVGLQELTYLRGRKAAGSGKTIECSAKCQGVETQLVSQTGLASSQAATARVSAQIGERQKNIVGHRFVIRRQNTLHLNQYSTI